MGRRGSEWDADGNLTALTYPDGTRTTPTYDVAGQLDQVSDPAAGTFEYDWSPDGQIEHIAFPNGASTDKDHDTQGQITASSTTGQDGATLLDLVYSYTDAGLLAEQTVTRGSTSLAWQYGWDARGVLDQVTGSVTGDVSQTAGGSVTALEDGTALSYSSSGLLESTTRDGVTTTYTSDARGNRTSRNTPAPHDTAVAQSGTANPEPVFEDPSATERESPASTDPSESGADEASTAASPSKGQDASPERTDSYGWDAADRLTNSLVGGTETSHTYFADGLRASATVDDVTASFVWATHATVSSLLADDTHRYVYGATGAPIAQIADDGVVSYLHGDMTGSIRTVTDRAGTVVAASDYSAYGVESPSGDVAVSQVTAFGYAGEYTDSTGLIYLRARYYDPGTAQFLSIDALVDLTQMPYGYTYGNPLQLVDPLGLAWWNPLDWDPDILDTVSAVAGGAAAILTVTGVGAPVGAVLGAVAVGASALSTVNRIRNGDELIYIALSAVGVVTGGTGAVASKFGQLMVRTARSANMYTRGTGSAGRAVADAMESFDVLSYTPLVFAGGARSAYCASVIW
jgi:RHS repeat-associated protein